MAGVFCLTGLKGLGDNLKTLGTVLCQKTVSVNFLDDVAKSRGLVWSGKALEVQEESDDPLKVCAGEDCWRLPLRSPCSCSDESAGMKSPASSQPVPPDLEGACQGHQSSLRKAGQLSRSLLHS